MTREKRQASQRIPHYIQSSAELGPTGDSAAQAIDGRDRRLYVRPCLRGHRRELGDERAAVQAAQFLESVGQDLEGRTGEKEKGKGEVHPAKLLRDSYLKPRALRRTTVLEEVGIADETVVDAWDVPTESGWDSGKAAGPGSPGPLRAGRPCQRRRCL